MGKGGDGGDGWVSEPVEYLEYFFVFCLSSVLLVGFLFAGIIGIPRAFTRRMLLNFLLDSCWFCQCWHEWYT